MVKSVIKEMVSYGDGGWSQVSVYTDWSSQGQRFRCCYHQLSHAIKTQLRVP